MAMLEYLRYKRKGLRRAWHLADMNSFSESVFKLFAVIIATSSIYAAHSNTVQMRLDQQAVELHDRYVNLSLTNKELKKIVAACVGPREGVIWIGDTMYMCGIANTGIKK